MFRYEHIYQHAVQALAKLQVPDFSDFDEEDVFDAFNGILLPSSHAAWLAHFQQLLHDASDGQTTMEEKPSYTGIRGMNRTYILARGEIRKRLIVMSGLPSMEIDDKVPE